MTAAITNTPTTELELKIYKRPNRKRWLELRKTCLTSTEMAPASGISKYGITRFSLYHAKRGSLEDQFEPNERSEIGKMIEHGIAKVVASRIGAKVWRLADFYVRGCMGASFDYQIDDLGGEMHSWLCEIKNVDYMIFRDQWDEDRYGNIIPPDHIGIQVQTQLEVSGRAGCLLCVLVGGNDLKMVKIARDEAFGAALQVVATDLWGDITAGKEPEVVAEDASVVPLVYTKVDPEAVKDATDDDILSKKLSDHKALGGQIKALEARRGEIKAQVLREIGESSKVFGMDGYTLDAGYTKANEGKAITADMVGELVGVRKGFRRFTVRKAKA